MAVYDWEQEDPKAWVLEGDSDKEEAVKAEQRFRLRDGELKATVYQRIREMRTARNQDSVSGAIEAMSAVIHAYELAEAHGASRDVFH